MWAETAGFSAFCLHFHALAISPQDSRVVLVLDAPNDRDLPQLFLDSGGSNSLPQPAAYRYCHLAPGPR